MNKNFLFAVLGVVALSATNASARPKVIYGDDNRLDLFQVTDVAMLQLADSTVALFQSSDVSLDVATGMANLSTTSFGEDFNLCTDEPFFEQNTGAFCSGSLVGPDLVLTAGHCIDSLTSCQNTKFVFGFGIKASGDRTPSMLASSEVYSCGSIVGRTLENSGADYAVIKLDRAVTGHAPLAINRSGSIAAGAPIVVIGHPSGLPTKVSAGANVRDASPTGYFTANLDTYGGNSGSAVFNTTTGLIEGVLVRGETDFTYRSGGGQFCRISYRCANDACRGEDVTKISAASAFIPRLPNEPTEPVVPTL